MGLGICPVCGCDHLGFDFGFNALKTTAVEVPTVTEAPIPAEEVTEPASEAMIEPAPASAAEQEQSSER